MSQSLTNVHRCEYVSFDDDLVNLDEEELAP